MATREQLADRLVEDERRAFLRAAETAEFNTTELFFHGLRRSVHYSRLTMYMRQWWIDGYTLRLTKAGTWVPYNEKHHSNGRAPRSVFSHTATYKWID